jgi:hypothetical protein
MVAYSEFLIEIIQNPPNKSARIGDTLGYRGRNLVRGNES